MLLFKFKPVIFTQNHSLLIVHPEKKVICNSWIIPFPYPHYNFYQALLNTKLYFVFFFIRGVYNVATHFSILGFWKDLK